MMVVVGNTMADFCYDCCVELFGGTDIEAEQNDFFGLITKEEFDKGWYAVVLCEGCGTIFVDHRGVKCTNIEQD